MMTGPSVAFCVLLDESGSMGRGSPLRGEAALQATILIVEAMKGIVGLELEVYSHTSCGSSDQDCLVRYLFGRKNPSPAAVGGYSQKRSNYDHQAIRAAARLFSRTQPSGDD